MLGRYSMVRGVRSEDLPQGIRQDTRKHTRHVLRPEAKMVERVLSHASEEEAWATFERQYHQLLEKRFASDREPFDTLAELARHNDVYLGCSCPTAKNPDVRRCHTSLALEFMHEHYPDLRVKIPHHTHG